MKTKRAFLVEPGRFEISEADIYPKDDQVLVKITACGLCNWELNHWKGFIGTFPQPLGHEWTGTVVELGPNVKGLREGDVVTALPDSLTGFSEYTVVSEKNCFKLAATVDPKYAPGEPLKCIVTVLRAAVPEAGDNGVVLGCGPMGLWCIQALSGNLLSSLVAVDIDEKKLELASKFGATHVINPQKEDAAKRIEDITDRTMADFVIEGTGIPALLNTAQHYIRRTGRGRLILMSSHESTCREFDFREAISRSAQIIVPHPGYSTDQHEDFRRAVSYLNNGVFKVKEVISHQFSLENIQKAFETLENKPMGYLKGIVLP
ncbi:MAG: zinc-dependent alcohol dehydrogenase [Bacillota bacterium]